MTEERVTYTTQLESRIAELEAMMRDTEDDLAATITAQNRRIKELEQTVARLEADNHRLRHLDSMPLDALRRLVEYCEWSQSEEYPVNQHIADYNAAIAHFRTLDGDA